MFECILIIIKLQKKVFSTWGKRESFCCHFRIWTKALKRTNFLVMGALQRTCSSMNYLNDAVTQRKNKEFHYSSSTECAVEFFIGICFQDDGFSNMTQVVFRSKMQKLTKKACVKRIHKLRCKKYQQISYPTAYRPYSYKFHDFTANIITTMLAN
jgi:hypothetical protein